MTVSLGPSIATAFVNSTGITATVGDILHHCIFPVSGVVTVREL